MGDQMELFDAPLVLPAGFHYQRELISPLEEQRLLDQISSLPFREFEFHGFVGKRRTVSFGWRYDFAREQLQRAEELPDFLLQLRESAAIFAQLPALDLRQALVTEYPAKAGIGWHRDKSAFEEVIGISLCSPCQFRLRRKAGEKWERFTLTTEPRSVYLLSGPARTHWEHSIPPVDQLRYSITFRSIRL